MNKVNSTDKPMQEAEWALIASAVARLRASIMALVFALTCGAGMFLATAWLVIRGGSNVGATLGLLRHYWPGYTVTWPGAFVGMFYAALFGGLLGWLIAFIYNRIVTLRHDR